ncbi:MAG TPA: MaoC family dehydratase [Caulobacteraceae bacterium]
MGGLRLEDLSLGQSAEHVHEVSEADIAAFATVSGDANPLHMDEAYAATTPFKGRIAHGMLGASYLSALLGNELPGPGSVYLSQSLRFRRPIRIGDVVTARVRVIAIEADKARVTLETLCLVDDKAAIDGEAVVMVARRGA